MGSISSIAVGSRQSLLADAKKLLDAAAKSGFNRETEARVNALLRLAELCNASPLDLANQNVDSFGRPRSVPGLMREVIERQLRRTLDPLPSRSSAVKVVLRSMKK